MLRTVSNKAWQQYPTGCCCTDTYIYQLCTDTGCLQEDMSREMFDRDGWRERVREMSASVCASVRVWLTVYILMYEYVHIYGCLYVRMRMPVSVCFFVFLCAFWFVYVSLDVCLSVRLDVCLCVGWLANLTSDGYTCLSLLPLALRPSLIRLGFNRLGKKFNSIATVTWLETKLQKISFKSIRSLQIWKVIKTKYLFGILTIFKGFRRYLRSLKELSISSLSSSRTDSTNSLDSLLTFIPIGNPSWLIH